MKVIKRSLVDIKVYDYKYNLLSTAKLSLKPIGREQESPITLEFDKQWNSYRVYDVTPGNYLLIVTADDFESDQREIKIDFAGLSDVFILGKKDMPFYYRGKVKVPFIPPKDLLGISVKPGLSGKEEEELLTRARELKLQLEKVSPAILNDNVRVFRFPQDTNQQEKIKLQQLISEHPLVQLAGPVIRINEHSVSFLTKEIRVKFKTHITQEQVLKIAKSYDLNINRRIPYAENTYLLQTKTQASLDVIKICAEIVKSGVVESAEPNLVITMEDDQINPTDYLYCEQWHIPHIDLSFAWQLLRNENPVGVMPGNPGDLTFGNEDIIIAVLDRGIQSQTVGGITSALHADFDGTVTSGANKVYEFYDFANMVPNNDNIPLIGGGMLNSHGMGCAGVASALANNNSVIAGVMEGTVGAAPNCRLMGLIRPAGGTEQRYADAYIWMAGFDPGWTIDNVNYFAGTVFPNPITPDADVITCSFGAGDNPISDLMKDCFTYLTSYGRNGKGVLLYFSASNWNVDFTTQRPWAAYEKTNAVAASTNADVRAAYSNFGTGIEICAPSSDGIDITTCDIIGQGNMPGHPALQTALSANVVAGATTLNVNNSVGFIVGQHVMVGAPCGAGTEVSQITAIPSGTQLTVNALANGHPTGTAVITGPNDYRNNFGGTSSATPLVAGVAALMLSANPDLSWVQVRHIIRETAVRIDIGNTDPIGQWVDTDGDGINDYSQWYGYGRVNAQAAVQGAINLIGVNPLTHIDTWIMENSSDIGDVPSMPPYSPDVWVRNVNPFLDNPAQVNQHQSPIRGQENWVYVNVRNRGSDDSHDVYARVFITHWAGTQYIYPDDFIPTNPLGEDPVQPLEPGTYLIGEEHFDSIPAGNFITFNLKWEAALIPPASVVIDGVTYSWADACLLVDVSPHDGVPPTGNNTWDNNNICQRNVYPIDPAGDDDFAIAFVVGHRKNNNNLFNLRIERKNLPAQVKLYFDYIDEGIAKNMINLLDGFKERPNLLNYCDLTILDDVKGEIHCLKTGKVSSVIIPSKTHMTLPCCELTTKQLIYKLNPIVKNKKTIFTIPTCYSTQVPILRKKGEYQIVALCGKGLMNLKKGQYQIDVIQEDLAGKFEGSLNFIINKA